MGLFDWIAALFGGGSADRPGDVADRLERAADRFSHAGNEPSALAARAAAARARLAPTVGAARQVEFEFLRLQGLRPDGRPLQPVLGRGPDDMQYVRYGNTLRAGGSLPWRYNNPGYVRCSSRSMSYGALGCDGEFAIFPDYWTGINALRLTLREDYPGQPIGVALRQHLPADAGVDPNRLCEQAGLDPATNVDDIPVEDFGGMGPAFQSQSGWELGTQFDRDAADNPSWVESTWDGGSATSGGSDMDFGGRDEPAPTDNS